MKPTIGNVSRAGVVPISSTLDTAGPMTKFVIDNILIYNAINDLQVNTVNGVDPSTLATAGFSIAMAVAL